jgi:outer membrane protein assembly factor BamB
MNLRYTKPFFRAIFFILLTSFWILIGCRNEEALDVKFSNIDTLIKNKREFEKIKVIIGTFLGNFERNYYGDSLPESLDIIWQYDIGTGKTRVGSIIKTWSGAGWTGQPLLIREDSLLYLIQNSYDYNLKKINAQTGKLVWQYEYDDVLKGTGTIWKSPDKEDGYNQFVIIQGSRQGFNNTLSTPVIPSLRAISYLTGEELWRFNSKKTESYSRDVDASALILKDTAYIGLEIGMFMVFDPDYKLADFKDSILQPKIYYTDSLYSQSDHLKHGGNLVTESSPSVLGNRVYIASGSGHVYGFNLTTKKIDWDFYIGSDIDGSPIVTSDSCILISIEKQYIAGNGGILKLNPAKDSKDAVVWYFPTENKEFVTWLGGVIGSCGINDSYNKNENDICIAAFMGIDGYLYVVNHKEIDSTKTVLGFDNITKYPTPKLLFKVKTGSSISTPIIVNNRLLAASYDALFLYEFDKDFNFTLLDKREYGSIEATPITHKGRIYLACRNGNLYCLGSKI